MTYAKVTVRSSEYETWLEVIGVGRIPVSEIIDDDFTGPVEVVAKASLTSLRAALIAYAGTESPPPRSITIDDPKTGKPSVIWFPQSSSPERCAVEVVDVPTNKFFERKTYEFLPEPVAITLLDGGVLAVRVGFVLEGEEEPEPELLTAVLGPLLRQTKSAVAHFDLEAQGEVDYRRTSDVHHPDFWNVHVYISVPTRGRSAESALSIGSDALALLEAAENGSLTRRTADVLVQSGRAELLVGQPEGAWLECKEQPYGADERAQYELAKDVSSFANSAGGGLILIGLRTRKVRGTDTITAVSPVPADDRRVDRYRKWLARRVHPRVVDLAIREIDYGRGRILVISVPPQPKALQPFFVRGAFRDGKIAGSNIAIFIRSGDAVVTTSVEEFHALVVAGRAALGYMPPTESGG
jgi:hypothetical protein